MYDDYTAPADVTAELSMLLEESRRLLTAVWAMDDHPYGLDYMLYHADRLQLTVHNLFGDKMPAPKPVPAEEIEPIVAAPVQRRRAQRFRRARAIAR
jgi:hypothetical protein